MSYSIHKYSENYIGRTFHLEFRLGIPYATNQVFTLCKAWRQCFSWCTDLSKGVNRTRWETIVLVCYGENLMKDVICDTLEVHYNAIISNMVEQIQRVVKFLTQVWKLELLWSNVFSRMVLKSSS